MRRDVDMEGPSSDDYLLLKENPQTKKWKRLTYCILVCFVITTIGLIIGMVAVARKDDSSSSESSMAAACSYQGVFEPDTEECECYQCFTGTNCETKQDASNCTIQAGSGQPWLYEEFWVNYTRDYGEHGLTFTTSMTYRIPYQDPNILPPGDDSSLPHALRNLNAAIRALHARINNVVTDGYYIVYSSGATSIWSAAMMALAARKNTKMTVFERVPYYPMHRLPLEPVTIDWIPVYTSNFSLLNSNALAADQNETLDPSTTIEILTLPCNPLGDMFNPIYPTADHIHDLVYYWPHLAPNMTQVFNEEIMLFSLTKLSGHASTRFGWALVKDPLLATTTAMNLVLTSLEVSSSIIRRATLILQALSGDVGDVFFPAIKQKMHERWDRITELYNNITQTRVTIDSVPNTAYLWIQFLQPEEQSDSAMTSIFNKLGVNGFVGSQFGDYSGKFRINLTLHSYAFDILLQRLRMLFMGTE